MFRRIEALVNRSKMGFGAAAVLLAAFIGVFDYLTGTHISLSAFYLLPVSLAAWSVGARFALLIAALSVGVSLAGGAISGDEDYTNFYIAAWNGSVQMTSYIVVVLALTRLRTLQSELEARVQERASALTREIAERERLQRELLEVSEQEHRRIGQDLHDGLCQHLAGTAIAGQVLRQKLEKKRLSEAKDAEKIVELIEDGIALSRRSAKGLHPVDMDAEGLMLALEEFSATASRLFNVNCRFECESPVLIHSAATAEHMFRIAQEAVRNAINHGHAREIVVHLNTIEDGQELRIEDDGTGLPAVVPSHTGMGLRMMAHRARMMGAAFEVRPGTPAGALVSCVLPSSSDAELTS